MAGTLASEQSPLISKRAKGQQIFGKMNNMSSLLLFLGLLLLILLGLHSSGLVGSLAPSPLLRGRLLLAVFGLWLLSPVLQILVNCATWLLNVFRPPEAALLPTHYGGTPQQHTSETDAASPAKPGGMSVCVSATFTADPVQRPLELWGETLGKPIQVSLTEYGSVFPQLLRPGSEFAGVPADGAKVILFRIEDWLPKGVDATAPQALEGLERTAEDFVRAVKQFAKANSQGQLVICECKPSPNHLGSAHVAAVGRRICQELSQLPGRWGVSYVPASSVDALYPVSDYALPAGDLGHLPYTDTYMVAVATCVVRRIVGRSPEHQAKVFVVDCDNTLWRGVVSEDGVAELGMSGVHMALQDRLVQLQAAGRLICLASKNEEADVRRVFDERALDMRLKPEHITAWAVNWKHKCSNLEKLAAKLNLGLESFVFIDDSPAEVEQMRLRLPQVTTVHLPTMTSDAAAWAAIDHAWCLDVSEGGPATKEDARRSLSYAQERQRQELKRASAELKMQAFIDSLGVEVDLHAMLTDEVARVAQLAQRTNQFNNTTVRRSETEVSGWPSAERGVICGTVRDRFGDYGLVVAVLWRREKADDNLQEGSHRRKRLLVDSWLMSCRVFDRGVEYRTLEHLASLARAHGCEELGIEFAPSTKNSKLGAWLGRLAKKLGSPVESGKWSRFVLPVAGLSDLDPDDFAEAAPPEETPAVAPRPAAPPSLGQLGTTAAATSKMRSVQAMLAKWRVVCGAGGLWLELPRLEKLARTVPGVAGARSVVCAGHTLLFVGPTSADQSAVVSACRKQLPPHMVPEKVVVVDLATLESETRLEEMAVMQRRGDEDSSDADMAALKRRIREVGILEVMRDEEAANAGWSSLELMRLAATVGERGEDSIPKEQADKLALAGVLGHVWFFTMVLVSMEWGVAYTEPSWFNAVGGVAGLSPPFSGSRYPIVDRLQSMGCLSGDPFFLMISGLQDMEAFTGPNGAGKLFRRGLVFGAGWLGAMFFSRILLRGPYLELGWTTEDFVRNESNPTGVLFEGNFIGCRAFLALLSAFVAWLFPGGGRQLSLPFVSWPLAAVVCGLVWPALMQLVAPSAPAAREPGWLASAVFAMDTRRYLAMYAPMVREFCLYYYLWPIFVGGTLLPKWRLALTRGLNRWQSALVSLAAALSLACLYERVGTSTLGEVRSVKDSHGRWAGFVASGFPEAPALYEPFWSEFVNDHDLYQGLLAAATLALAVLAAPTRSTIFSRMGTQILTVYLTLPLVIIPLVHYLWPLILDWTFMPTVTQGLGFVGCGLLTILLTARPLPEFLLQWVETGRLWPAA